MEKKLGKKLDRLLTLVIAVILLPLFHTIFLQRMKLEESDQTICGRTRKNRYRTKRNRQQIQNRKSSAFLQKKSAPMRETRQFLHRV